MKGIPTRGDTPRIWIRYIRGVNKAANWEKAYNDAAAQWASKNNGLLGIARNNMTVMGQDVPVGYSFKKFAQEVASRHFEEVNKLQGATKANKAAYDQALAAQGIGEADSRVESMRNYGRVD